MAIYTLRCPECTNKFKSPTIEGPEKCPFCKLVIREEAPDNEVIEIKAPFLGTARNKAVDDSYRQLEASSERRMEQAAQEAGCSVSDMSALKITDIKTGVKPGESYVPEVRNAVTQQMDAIRAQGGMAGFSGADAANLASQVRSGPHPNAGAKTLASIQKLAGRG